MNDVSTIPSSSPALLAAQAKAGQAGVDAYQAAIDQLTQQRQSAVDQAMKEAALRGAPGNAVASIQSSVTQPYDSYLANLKSGQAAFQADQAARASRLADYNSAVLGARSLISDQTAQAVAPINAKASADVANIEGQSRAKVAELQGQAQLALLQLQAKQAAAAKSASAAAQKGVTLTGPQLQQQLIDAAKGAVPQDLTAAANPATGISQSYAGDIARGANYAGQAAAQEAAGQAGTQGTPTPAITSDDPSMQALLRALAAIPGGGAVSGTGPLYKATGPTIAPADVNMAANYAGQAAAAQAPTTMPRPAAGAAPGWAGYQQPIPGAAPAGNAAGWGAWAIPPPAPAAGPAPAAARGTPRAQATAAFNAMSKLLPPPAPTMAGSPQSPQQAAAQSYMSGLSAIPGSPIGAAAIAQSGRFPVAPIEYAQGLLESPDFYAPMLSRAAAALGQAGYLSTPANQSTAQAQALQKLIDDATTANDKLNAKAVTAQKAADTGAAKADKATLSGNFADAFDGANLAHVASKSGLQPEQVVNVMLNPDNPAGAAQAQKNYDDFKAAIADKSKNLTTPKAVETWLGQNITDPIIRRILGAMDMRAKG